MVKREFVFLILILVIVGNLGLVVGEEFDSVQNTIVEVLGRIDGDYSGALNIQWDLLDDSVIKDRKTKLLKRLDGEEKKKLWEALNDENKIEFWEALEDKQGFFDLLKDEQKTGLWNALEVKKGALGLDVDWSETNLGRNKLLWTLNYEQQKEMLGLVLKENNGRDVKIKWPEGMELDYKNDVVSFMRKDKEFKASLKNNPGLNEIEIAEDVTFIKGEKEWSMFLSFENENMVALRDGSWAELDHTGKRVAVKDKEDELLGYVNWGDSKEGVVLYGVPADVGDVSYEKGFHVWAKGHGGEGINVEIPISEKDESLGVFPNPEGREVDGLNYAFVRKHVDEKGIEGFYLDGSLVTSEVGMYGSEVYVSFDKGFEVGDGEEVVRFFDDEGVEGVKISGNAFGKITFSVEKDSIFQADGSEKMFKIISENGKDVYVSHSFGEEGLEEYVPNVWAEASHVVEGVERVGNGDDGSEVESEEDGDSEVEEEISLGNEVEEILGDKDVEVESENGVTEVEDCEDGSGCPGGVCDVGDEEKVLDSFEGARDWMSDFIIPSETDSLQSTNSDSLSLPSNFYNNQDTAKMASGVSYNLYGKNVEDIELVTLVLGADWCPGCKNTKGMLETNEIPYFRVDVDQNKGLYNHYRDPTITSIPQTIFINRKTGNVEHRVTGELSRNMFNNAVNTARKNANF
jgi:hypothetical protein